MSIEEFIQENIVLIDKNDWEIIYKNAYLKFPREINDLTEIFHSCDIYPEKDLVTIPRNFMKRSDSESIEIPDNVVNINEYAYAECYNLKDLKLSRNLKDIGDHAFDACSALTDVVIPDGVETIGEYAFYYCLRLQSVVIPASVTNIKYKAFSSCNEHLVVKYKGSKEQWEAIEIDPGDYERNLRYNKILYNYRGI